MIPALHHQRLRHLGQVASNDNAGTSFSDPRFTEPPGRERLANPKAFSGNHCALEALPPLGLTFESIRASCIRRGLPALDVGASVSTVAAEGALRGITIHSTELPPIKHRDRFIEAIRTRLAHLGEYYRDSSIFPPGFECDSLPERIWDSCVHDVILKVSETLTECSAARIVGLNYTRALDQSYSVVFSHHAVPKYCSTDSFLHHELPELLRVTAERLHLYPFRSAGPENEYLHLHGSETYQRIAQIADQAGFSFQTSHAEHLFVDPHAPLPEPGFDTTAVFVRRAYFK